MAPVPQRGAAEAASLSKSRRWIAKFTVVNALAIRVQSYPRWSAGMDCAGFREQRNLNPVLWVMAPLQPGNRPARWRCSLAILGNGDIPCDIIYFATPTTWDLFFFFFFFLFRSTEADGLVVTTTYRGMLCLPVRVLRTTIFGPQP
jgi:hypothetical protein